MLPPSDRPAELLARLAEIDTTSLADAGRGSVRVLPSTLRPVRPGLRLLGTALTVEARDDLMPMLAALQLAGAGDVLVVAGSDVHAVAGELFGTEALRRGMGGIVIDGLCRDTRTLAQLELPVYARGAVPSAPPARSSQIVVQQPITVAGVRVDPGDIVLGDDDGVVVASADEVEALIEAAAEIQQREVALQRAIAGGSSLFDHLDFDEHLADLRAGRPSSLRFS
jgi:regulator of RNase E activity RraA